MKNPVPVRERTHHTRCEDIFHELYGVEVSAGLISKVTNAVTEQIIEWQSRPLEAIYPLIYLNCIVVKIRQDKTVINKAIYLTLEEQALLEIERFAQTWDGKYPQISRSWRDNWHNLNTLFIYPAEIRKAIYTTNAIESLNSVIRKSVKKRKVFPYDESARKVIFLERASKKWTMPIHNWKLALNRFAIEFPERLIGYLI